MAGYQLRFMIVVVILSMAGFGCSRDLENKKPGAAPPPGRGRPSAQQAKGVGSPATAPASPVASASGAPATGVAPVAAPVQEVVKTAGSSGPAVAAQAPQAAPPPQAALPPKSPTAAAATTITEVKLAAPAAAQQCLTCHQVESYLPFTTGTPYLVGQSVEYILFQLNQYRLNRRNDPSRKMKEIAEGLAIKVLEANEIAEYFSKLKLQRPKEEAVSYRDMNLAKRGERIARDKCTSCHMNAEYNNGPTDPLVPRLAGQSKQYLFNQLLEYQEQEEVKPRRNKLMSSLASKLTDDDMEAVSAFFASQK